MGNYHPASQRSRSSKNNHACLLYVQPGDPQHWSSEEHKAIKPKIVPSCNTTQTIAIMTDNKCRCSLWVYPCGHSVAISFTPCTPQCEPDYCLSGNGIPQTTRWCFRPKDATLKCPSKACSARLLSPIELAEACKDVSVSEALNRIPAWIYDIDGKPIGVNMKGHKLLHYLLALMSRQPTGQHQTPAPTQSIPDNNPAASAQAGLGPT